MKIIYLFPLFLIVLIPVFGYNSGFRPVYQPSETLNEIQRENSVGIWTVDSVKTNIGISFVDVYTTGQGDPLRIDTNGKTTATLLIDWTNIGIGTQTCQIVSSTNSTIVLIRLNNLVSGLNTNATQDIPTNAENMIDIFKPQCKSTTGIDAPIWLTGQVLLR